MGRRGSVLALGLALLALPSVAHPAQERSACQELSARHDLAPANRVKLVERKNDDGGKDLVGCVLPAGKIVKAASSSESTGAKYTDYDLRQVAGHQVLVHRGKSNQLGARGAFFVVDLKKDRSYAIARSCHEEVGGFCDPDETDDFVANAVINAGGQAVAAVQSRESDLRTVEGFSPRGTRVILDSGTRAEIPASSLKLEGHVASWKHSGAHKSARLPGVSECQKLTAKDDLAPARRVKLVERKNADGGTDLVGCVLPAGKVSPVASSAKQTSLARTYRILQVAGHEALIRGAVTNQYGRGVSTYVYDIKRASSYNVAESCFDEHGAACDQTYARRAFVNAQGQAAALVRTDGSSELEVIGLKSTGAGEVLDTGTAAEIPASSLSLEGHVARWTHSGAPRSATLSG